MMYNWEAFPGRLTQLLAKKNTSTGVSKCVVDSIQLVQKKVVFD
jgi:hypothetical protein